MEFFALLTSNSVSLHYSCNALETGREREREKKRKREGRERGREQKAKCGNIKYVQKL